MFKFQKIVKFFFYPHKHNIEKNKWGPQSDLNLS